MDVDATFRAIKTLYQTVSTKSDVEVSLIFKGNSYGVTQPYHARVGDREANHETYDGALKKLLTTLKEELAHKVKTTESEANRLRSALAQLDN